MYSAHQVRGKARLAVRRREEQVEQDEIEGGELNLIPYLDIVTNLMLFLLASVSASVLLGQLNTMLPDQAPASASTDTSPATKPEDMPLKLVVSVTKENILLWSISQREGTLKQPRLVLQRVGKNGSPCDGGYMCESGYCDSDPRNPIPDQTCAEDPEVSRNPNVPPPPPLPVFDYRALNQTLYDIAKQHYGGKVRPMDTYQAVLMADDSTPYETLVSVMGAMRCKLPELGTKTDRCYLPSADEELAAAASPLDEDNRLFDTRRVVYDPDTLALFNDILFSRGFE
jgi:biopolymer transport protein ExbD